MNYLQMIQKTWSTQANGEIIASWDDIDEVDQSTVMIELNNALRDIFLNFDYVFQDRNTTLTCVPGQFNYDMPFNGKLKQDGLLIQPIDSNSNKIILTNNPNKEQFYLYSALGMPAKYCIFGDELLLLPTPDKSYICTCLYETNNWALSVTTVKNSSASGQKVLSVNSTKEYNLNDIIYINKGKSTEETGVISSIQSDISLTLVGNLTFTHNSGERITVERQELKFENDEPNFPSEYHYTIVYAALATLLYGDTRQEVYINRYQDSLENIISRSKNSQEGGSRIRIFND